MLIILCRSCQFNFYVLQCSLPDGIAALTPPLPVRGSCS